MKRIPIPREEQAEISAGARERAERSVTKALANPEMRAVLARNRKIAREREQAQARAASGAKRATA
jgi:hypothetical protein